VESEERIRTAQGRDAGRIPDLLFDNGAQLLENRVLRFGAPVQQSFAQVIEAENVVAGSELYS
jgi:hypothetical protein